MWAKNQIHLGLIDPQAHGPNLSHVTSLKAGVLLFIGGLSWMAWHLLGQATTEPSLPGSLIGQNTPRVQLNFAENNRPAKTGDVDGSSVNFNALQPISTTPALVPSWSNSATPEASACDGQLRQASFAYEPVNPIKAGNYIHFLASQDVSLCVRDQQNQLTSLNLKAGSSRSVYGDPPFLVHSPKWSSLQVFFQGRPVSGIPEDSAHWLFKTRAL
ncbi:MAG: hypothetical protein CFE38_19085 [Comamonadaceae bacterium PBBC1]|nr:MAG: hypothetical protein CFE38_19085 [Comamonadaceae bacterium PBBC1]